MTGGLLLRRGWLLPLGLSLFVDNVRGTPVRAAAVLAAGFWGASVLLAARRRPDVSLSFLLFLAWSAVGFLWSVSLSNALSEWSLLAGAAFLFAGGAVLFAEHPEEKPVFARAVLLLGLLKGLSPFLSSNPDYWAMANRSFVPMFMTMALFFSRPLEGKAWRAGWFLLLAVDIWFCVHWNAMSALLGLAVGFPLEAALRRRRPALWVGAGAAGALVAAALLWSGSPRWLRNNPDDPERMERLVMWKDAAAYAGEKGLVGTGLGTFEQYYPRYKSLEGARTANFAHNEWIQLLCESGLIGLVLALMAAAGLFRRVLTRGPAPSGAALMLLGLWSLLYYVFRSDGLLFLGALFIADGAAPAAPLGRPARGLVAGLLGMVGAVSFSQGTAGVMERWGGLAWDAGETEIALARFRAAARWNPLEPRFLEQQVECLRRLDRKPEALPLLERAVALKPRDVWLRRKLAVARLATSGPAAARETYAPILELAPNVPQFRREYEELR